MALEQDDFADVPPPKYKRLIEGGEVRLRCAYVIKCHQLIKDAAGKVVELRCTYDENTLGKKQLKTTT
jgi:glutaminyl-tRNA synthetase